MPTRREPPVSTVPVLSVEALSKRYREGAPVLDDVNLSLARGEYLAIMGESGVGKSTLLNLLAGLDRPDSGCVRLEGRDLTQLDDDAMTLLRRQRIGFVFQAFHVLPYLSIERNVALPLELLGTAREERIARTAEMLEAVGLGGRATDFPHQLSGGELQRVAIARALIHRPALLLADEPTGNLDPRTAVQILTVLREQLRRCHGSAILITHSRAAADTADRIVRFDGRQFLAVT